MATAAQVLANRENAQLSTGPRSEEGKAKSSLNALRHGLAARGLIVLPGQEDAFTELEDGLRTGLNPSGTLQDVLFKRVLESAWNLHRCRLAEAQLYLSATDSTIDPLLDDKNEAKSTRIQKYARQSENSMHKALRELGRLQTEDQYRHEAFPLTEEQRNDEEAFAGTVHALSDVCSIEKITTTLAKTGRLDRKSEPSSAKDAMAMLKAFCRPPSSPSTFQFEANEAGDDSQAA